MSAVFYVYCWTNKVNGKQYIGKGSGRRAKMHLTAFPSHRSYISRAIQKSGAENFRLAVLFDGLFEAEALHMEKALILQRRTKAPSGYNLTDGGEGASGYKKTAAQRAAVSAWLRANPPKGNPLIGESTKGRSPPNKLPDGVRQEARRLRGEGCPFYKVAEVLGVSKTAVRNWCKEVA